MLLSWISEINSIDDISLESRPSTRREGAFSFERSDADYDVSLLLFIVSLNKVGNLHVSIPDKSVIMLY
jgi:hypothetical protein